MVWRLLEAGAKAWTCGHHFLLACFPTSPLAELYVAGENLPLEQLQQWPPKQGLYFSFECSPYFWVPKIFAFTPTVPPKWRPPNLNWQTMTCGTYSSLDQIFRYRVVTGWGGLTLTTTMARAAPSDRGGAALTERDGGEAQRWRSEVERGSAVVEIGAGGRWAKLRLYGVRR